MNYLDKKRLASIKSLQLKLEALLLQLKRKAEYSGWH